jgi:hypothetical protein
VSSNSVARRSTWAKVRSWFTRRRMLRAAAAATSGLLLTCGCGPLASRVLLFPPSAPASIGGAARIILADPAGAIETLRASSPGAQSRKAQAIILRFYGNASQADSSVVSEAAEWGQWPIELWGVNFAGYGASEGSSSLRGVVRAADVAYDAAALRGVPIYVVGTSMGTTAALHLSATRAVKGTLLINPPPLRHLVLGRYGWWNLWLLAGPVAVGIPSALNSVDNAENTKSPVVILTSELDSVVPASYQDKVYNALGGPKEHVVSLGCDHNDPPTGEAAAQVRAALLRQGWGK